MNNLENKVKESYKLINEIFCKFVDMHYSHAIQSYKANLKNDFKDYLKKYSLTEL